MFCILLSYFNYHLRADWLEVQDYTKLLNSGRYELEIITKPRQNPYYQSEFTVELKAKQGLDLRSLILPYRLVASTSSSKGLELGDIISLDTRKNPKSQWQVEELSEYQAKILRKDKVSTRIKNKNLVYLRHKQSAIQNIQNWIRHNYESQLSYENSQIVTSLILGSRVAKLPDKFSAEIRNLGLTHIFAASGFNLLIISATLLWLFGIFKLSNKFSYPLIIFSTLIYTALAGFSPSIVRAWIFVAIFMLLKLLGRQPLSARFLIVVAGLVLAIDPYAIFDIGFQLSYLATLALILFASPIQARVAGLMPQLAKSLSEKLPDARHASPSKRSLLNVNEHCEGEHNNADGTLRTGSKYFQEIISTGIAVQLILMPLIIYYFHSAQIWALAANIIFTPFVTLIIILAILGLGIIVEPLMNIFKYMLELSEHLPLINTRLELDYTSYILLTLLFIYIAIIIGKYEDDSYKFLRAKDISITIISSLILFLIAGNAPAIGVESIDLYHGKFSGKYAAQINSFLENKTGPCYKYTNLAGLKTLIIKDKRNLCCMQELDGNIEEVQLLIVPKLGAGDIYLDTLINLTKPQFAITNITKDSSRAKYNLDLLNSSCNTIANSGKLYISRGKFWSLASYE